MGLDLVLIGPILHGRSSRARCNLGRLIALDVGLNFDRVGLNVIVSLALRDHNLHVIGSQDLRGPANPTRPTNGHPNWGIFQSEGQWVADRSVGIKLISV